ncbi:MAG: type II secretion system F family protein [Myxococcales bacterium]|nr:type II secretion system F family protein [Myxococcales bacterium]
MNETSNSEIIRYGALLLMMLAAGSFGAALACVPGRPRPTTGRRGEARRRMLEELPVMALLEPPITLLGSTFAALPFAVPGRERLNAMIADAGDFGGLEAEDLWALSLLLGLSAYALLSAIAAPPFWITVAAFACLIAPVVRLGGLRDRRRASVARDLPTVIDVMALCMGAGLDFASALQIGAREAAPADSPLRRELEHAQKSIVTGRSRQRALSELAERIPSPALQDFVGAVVQGELKGTPLSRVLEVQARSLRTRRAVAAEEAATRAGLLLMAPLLMLLCCVMLLLFSPLLIKGFDF